MLKGEKTRPESNNILDGCISDGLKNLTLEAYKRQYYEDEDDDEDDELKKDVRANEEDEDGGGGDDVDDDKRPFLDCDKLSSHP